MAGRSSLQNIQQHLSPWEWQVLQHMDDATIPPGSLITYGRLSEIATGSPRTARAVAQLRRKLYGLLGHDTELPLHRIAKQGDVHSLADSVTTKAENDRRRAAEGSLAHPKWI